MSSLAVASRFNQSVAAAAAITALSTDDDKEIT
jgi:hypothetical protein